jgi:hypothetical protein
MSAVPELAFFLSHPPLRVVPGDTLWRAPLPMDRHGDPGTGAAWRLGDYLGAIGTRLLEHDAALLRSALRSLWGQPVASGALAAVQVYQEKHGAYYHPVRLRAYVAGSWRTLALTAALSLAGRRLLARECDLLRRLQRDHPSAYLPRVLAQDRLHLAGESVPCFLGEWFSGYHEFHPGLPAAGSETRLALWHARRGRLWLSDARAAGIYRQAAAILTHFYDVASFAQIYPWHHAAGDFVARLGRGRPSVRLISVRQHAPMVAFEDNGAQARMDALLFFLLNLTIRNRLDRLDGVGEIVWAGESSVRATLEGFWLALALKRLPDHPRRGDLAGAFRTFLAHLSAADIRRRCRDLLEASNPQAPDTVVVARHLPEHARLLARLLPKHGACPPTTRSSGGD